MHPVVNESFIKLLSDRKDEWVKIQEELKAERLIREKEEKARLAEEEKERKMRENAEEELKALLRGKFEKELRNVFLDAGMDIKVDVRGKKNDQLILSYPLFNDVWLRRFDKEGLISKWREMGFKRIDMKDNYDYHKYYVWED